MKAIARLLLLFFSFTTQAQYQSFFGQSSTEWSETFSNFFGPFTYQYSIGGDTTIGSVSYKKIQGPFTAFIREDTTTGKVWTAFQDVVFTERLAADYSLTLGDTFMMRDLFPFPSNDTAVIVDSVYMLNGRKHIRFNYEYIPFNSVQKLLFIEGVGTTYGLLYQLDELNITPFLLCKYKDNVQEFANTQFNGNCTVTGLEQSTETTEIRLTPQGEGYLLTMNSQNEHLEWKIIDMQARIIKSANMHLVNGEYFISTADLKQGLYVISVYSPRGHLSSRILR